MVIIKLGILNTLLFYAFITHSAFAKMSDCKLTEVLLTPVPSKDLVTIKFCEIPAATDVLIGSKDDDGNARHDEKPVRKMDFGRFQIAQYTVTQLQYKTVMHKEPWKEFIPSPSLKESVQEGDDYPAVYVSYDDAQEFVHRASIIDQSAIWRLPTEAEWEYAARGDPKIRTKYYWGDNFDERYVYSDKYTRKTQEWYAHRVDSCPVEAFDCSNQFGLMHMIGNVSQWTYDIYGDDYMKVQIPNKYGRGIPHEIQNPYRVIRGCSWNILSYVSSCRSANRSKENFDMNNYDIGFRPVRIPK